MPRGDTNTPLQESVKLLLIGDSGKGKTGAIVSLLLAGYSVRLLDFDNGHPIIRNIVRDTDPSKLVNFHYETCLDEFKNLNGRLVAKKAKAWPKATKLLDKWTVGTEGEEGYYTLGPIYSWTSQDVLVLDSLTYAGECAMRYHQHLNGKLGTHPSLPDWGVVQTLMKDLLEMLRGDELKCHVVVTSHIDYRYREVKNDKGQVVSRELEKGYPNAPGNKLPEKVGSYFNTCLEVMTTGTGNSTKHWLTSKPTSVLDLKNPNPNKVQARYPIETGLAQFFEDVRK